LLSAHRGPLILPRPVPVIPLSGASLRLMCQNTEHLAVSKRPIGGNAHKGPPAPAALRSAGRACSTEGGLVMRATRRVRGCWAALGLRAAAVLSAALVLPRCGPPPQPAVSGEETQALSTRTYTAPGDATVLLPTLTVGTASSFVTDFI